ASIPASMHIFRMSNPFLSRHEKPRSRNETTIRTLRWVKSSAAGRESTCAGAGVRSRIIHLIEQRRIVRPGKMSGRKRQPALRQTGTAGRKVEHLLYHVGQLSFAALARAEAGVVHLA